MSERLRAIYQRHRGVIAYVFFGGCTTLINVLCYDACYYLLGMANVPATASAWAVSVLFAFVTNKLFVFESRSWAVKTVLYEAGTFFACRILTGLLDVLIMYLAVDRLGGDPTLFKLLSNVIVIILNYAASKIFIFRRK